MIQAVPDILGRIVTPKRQALGRLLEQREDLERLAAASLAGRRGFQGALQARTPAIIAEIKQASPSKGLLSSDFQPGTIARDYARGGAAALSVLTDGPFFHGSLAHLAEARAACALPVLRKDFTIGEIQVIEAAAHGADAVLLIAAILTKTEMQRFRELAREYDMAALVEVHNAEELARAADSGAEIIGVNNRNLHTFEVKLETSLKLAESMPAGVLKVSESGIHSAADVRRLMDAGYRAFLVGEHLMKSGDPAAALEALRQP
jgi:indole-3-glycerol phosphate synthase